VKKEGLRCRFHGGRSTGPRTPEGKVKAGKNRPPIVHGIYGDKITDEENEWARTISGGSGLAHEIFVARLQIRRALAAWDEWSDANPEDERQMPMVEIKTSTTSGEAQRAEILRRRPDLWHIIDRALGRVGHLQQQEATIHAVQQMEEAVQAGLARIPGED
jgi:hypothetical protein